MPSYKNKHMKNTCITLVYSKSAAHRQPSIRGRSQSSLYSLNLFSPSMAAI